MSPTTKVYVLLRGEFNEGGHVLGVYASRKSARVRLIEVTAKLRDVEIVSDDEHREGCDYYEVEEWEVQL